jgi:hypothetical protein
MAILDPKFDQLPADAQGDFENIPWDQLTEEQRAAVRARRQGLSINDTIAATANTSVGARGFDFSGVEGGAGAGAGMTYLSPAAPGESPAPSVMPGARGTGNAPRGEWIIHEEQGLSPDLGPTRDEIAARAYQLWQNRGCPHGGHEEDWRLAEEQLRAEQIAMRQRKPAESETVEIPITRSVSA